MTPGLRLTPRWLRPLSGGAALLAYAALFALAAARPTAPVLPAPVAEVVLISMGEATDTAEPSPVSAVASPQSAPQPAETEPEIETATLPEPAPAEVAPAEPVLPEVVVPDVPPPVLAALTRPEVAAPPAARPAVDHKRIELERRKRAERAQARRQRLEDQQDERRRAARPRPASASAPSEARQSRAGTNSAADAASAVSKAQYGALVAAELNRHKVYPVAARASGVTGAVSVAYAIGAGGRIASHSILRSSGHAELDAAVRSMFRAAHPPPPPGGSFRSSVTIHFHLAR